MKSIMVCEYSIQGQGHFMMTKSFKIRLQVSVLRTNGPLVHVFTSRLSVFNFNKTGSQKGSVYAHKVGLKVSKINKMYNYK